MQNIVLNISMAENNGKLNQGLDLGLLVHSLDTIKRHIQEQGNASKVLVVIDDHVPALQKEAQKCIESINKALGTEEQNKALECPVDCALEIMQVLQRSKICIDAVRETLADVRDSIATENLSLEDIPKDTDIQTCIEQINELLPPEKDYSEEHRKSLIAYRKVLQPLQKALQSLSNYASEVADHGKHTQDCKAAIQAAVKSLGMEDIAQVLVASELQQTAEYQTALQDVEQKAQSSEVTYKGPNAKQAVNIKNDDTEVGANLKRQASITRLLRTQYAADCNTYHEGGKSSIDQKLLQNPKLDHKLRAAIYHEVLYPGDMQHMSLPKSQESMVLEYDALSDAETRSKEIKRAIQNNGITVELDDAVVALEEEQNEHTVDDVIIGGGGENNVLGRASTSSTNSVTDDATNARKLEVLIDILNRSTTDRSEALDNINPAKPNLFYGIGLVTVGNGCADWVPLDVIPALFTAKMALEYVQLKHNLSQKPKLTLLIADKMALDALMIELGKQVPPATLEEKRHVIAQYKKTQAHYIKVIKAVLNILGMQDDVELILSSQIMNTADYQSIIADVNYKMGRSAVECAEAVGEAAKDMVEYYFRHETAHMKFVYDKHAVGVKQSYVYAAEAQRLRNEALPTDLRERFQAFNGSFSELRFDIFYEAIYPNEMRCLHNEAGILENKCVPHYGNNAQNAFRQNIGGPIEIAAEETENAVIATLSDRRCKKIAESPQYAPMLEHLSECARLGLIASAMVPIGYVNGTTATAQQTFSAHMQQQVIEEMQRIHDVEMPEINIEELIGINRADAVKHNNMLLTIYRDKKFSVLGLGRYIAMNLLDCVQESPKYSALPNIRQLRDGVDSMGVNLEYVSCAVDCTVSMAVLCAVIGNVELGDCMPFLACTAIYVLGKVVTDAVRTRNGEKGYISTDFAKMLEYALAQGMMVSALPLCRSNTLLFLDFLPSEMVNPMLGVVIIAPAMMSVLRYIGSLENDFEEEYGQLSKITQGILQNAPKFLIPYLLSTMGGGMFAFAGAGLGFGLSGLISDLRVQVSTKPKADEDEGVRVANAVFKATVYAASGMLLYSAMPLHTLAAGSIGVTEIMAVIGIGVVDAILIHYVLPALVGATRKADQNRVGMTKKEKIDFAVMALILGSALALAVGNADASFHGVGLLTSIAPFVVTMALYPLVLRLKSVMLQHTRDTESDDRAKLPILTRTAFYVVQGGLMATSIVCGMNLLTNAGAISKITTALSVVPELKAILVGYEEVVGGSLLVHLASAFCMSFVIYGMIGCATRAYEALTSEKICGDNTKRQYMTLESVIRFPIECLKYAGFSVLQGLSIVAGLVSGAILGTGRFIVTAASSQFHERCDKKKPYGGTAVASYVASEFIISLLTGIYDQMGYFALTQHVFPAMDSVMHEYISDALKVASAAVLVECPEAIMGDLLRQKRREVIEERFMGV